MLRTPANYHSLRDFGYTFLGPIFGAYLHEVVNDYPAYSPVCLAREGFLIHRLISRAHDRGLARQLRDPIYLKVSRTVLFRALLADDELWPELFGKPFEGTLQALLCGRFGCKPYMLEEISRDKLNQRVKLPADASNLLQELQQYRPQFEKVSRRTLNSLKKYLGSLGLDNPKLDLVFLDVGYSGTIQKLLTRILERDSYGKYIITAVERDHKVGRYNCYIEGTALKNAQWGQGDLLLDRSILLESLLTAPHGQVKDVYESENGEFNFSFGKRANAQIYFHELEAIFSGCEECVLDMLDRDISFSSSELSELFAAFSLPISAIPRDIRYLFDIDDDFSGNGILNATELFGL